MASTYAHYRFGNDVLTKLPYELQQKIKAHKSLYMTGLHGPDILFYYRPFSPDSVNQRGYNMHKLTGTQVFEEMFEKVVKCSEQDREAAEVYMLGFLCHYALDRNCHPFIESWIQKYHISHAEIEVEFDRALMVNDGIDPVSHRLTDHITTSRQDAGIIQIIFGEFTRRQIRKTLKSMRFYNNLLVAPGEWKRKLVRAVLKWTGNETEMSGLLVNREPNPACLLSSAQLMELYQIALNQATSMLIEMDSAVKTGNLNLPASFEHTFGAE